MLKDFIVWEDVDLVIIIVKVIILLLKLIVKVSLVLKECDLVELEK